MHIETEATQHLQRAAAPARAASHVLARTSDAERNAALRAMAASLRSQSSDILAANAADLAACTGTAAFRDRLALNEARVDAMAQGLEDIALLPDPLGRTLADWTRPNGLRIQRIATPIGVIGMIYESRPNVGADAAGICLKSGNAVILRGGSESVRSAAAINAALVAGLRAVGLPEACVQIAPNADRAYVAAMLAAAGLLDLIVPRGGKSLVERVQREARVPVLAHAEGLCHTYVHASADHAMARRIVANAKMRRTGICGATETLLIDRAIAPALLPAHRRRSARAGLRLPRRCRGARHRARPRRRRAQRISIPNGWMRSCRSPWSMASMPRSRTSRATAPSTPTPSWPRTRQRRSASCNGVDSAVALWNASTQFCDGGEFGFGAEIGIATGRIHARGPVGPEQLTTYRYLVIGTGQVRP